MKKNLYYILALLTFFISFGIIGYSFAYNSGLKPSAYSSQWGPFEPDNNGGQGGVFNSVLNGSMLRTAPSWNSFSKLPFRKGEVPVAVFDKHTSMSSAAVDVTKMKNKNGYGNKNISFTDAEEDYLKKLLKSYYKTSNNKNYNTNGVNKGFYSEERDVYGNEYPATFPLKSYYKDGAYAGNGNSRIENYPIWGFNRLYLQYLKNGNNGVYDNSSTDRILAKASQIATVYKANEGKYIGKSVILSNLLGLAYGVLLDKQDLFKIYTYGAFNRKYELISQTNGIYFPSDEFAAGTIQSQIKNSCMQTNDGCALGNRYDMPIYLGKKSGLISDGNQVQCNTVNSDYKYVSQSCTNKSFSDISKYGSIPYTDSSLGATDRNAFYNQLESLVKKTNEFNGSNSNYTYLIQGSNGRYFLQPKVSNAGNLEYYNDSSNGEYGNTAYTNVWGNAEYLLLLDKFVNFGVKVEKNAQSQPKGDVLTFVIYNNGDITEDNSKLSKIGMKKTSKRTVNGKYEIAEYKYNIYTSSADVNTLKKSFYVLTTIDPNGPNAKNILVDVVTNDNTEHKKLLSDMGRSGNPFTVNGVTYYGSKIDILPNNKLDLKELVVLGKDRNGKIIEPIDKALFTEKSSSTTSSDSTPTSNTNNGGGGGGGGGGGSDSFQYYKFDSDELLGFKKINGLDSDEIYSKFEDGDNVSWKNFPLYKMGLIIGIRYRYLTSSEMDELTNNYNCKKVGSDEATCNIFTLKDKGFFNDYPLVEDDGSPVYAYGEVCSENGSHCSVTKLGKAIDTLTSNSYSLYSSDEDYIGQYDYSVWEAIDNSKKYKLPELSYSSSNKIKELIDNSTANGKVQVRIVFSSKDSTDADTINNNAGAYMLYDDAYIYKVKKAVKCSLADVLSKHYASSTDSWASLGDIVEANSNGSPVDAITKIRGKLEDNNGSSVGNGRADVNKQSTAGIDDSSDLVSSNSASYPLTMSVTAYFDSSVCSNSSATVYPDIQICPSKIDINNLYISKIKNGSNPLLYSVDAYTTYPGDVCGSLDNAKLSIKGSDVSLTNCSNSDGKYSCQFNLPKDVIKSINDQSTIDDYKKQLSTTFKIDYEPKNGNTSTAAKTKDAEYQGTCIGKQPYFTIDDINNDKIVGNNGYDSTDRDSINNFIKSTAGNDRRLNRKRIKLAYYGCNAVTGYKLNYNDGVSIDKTIGFPNIFAKKLFLDSDSNTANMTGLFNEIDLDTEDRLSNPINKNIIVNLGYRDLGIKDRPDDIIGTFSDLQNVVNDNAVDKGLPRPEMDLKLKISMIDNKSQIYTGDYSDNVPFFGYCYPYPVLVPTSDDGTQIHGALIKNIYSKNSIKLQYRGCDVLTQFDLRNIGGKLHYSTGDTQNILLGYKRFAFTTGSITTGTFNDTNMKCNSADLDKDGTPCNSANDKKAIEAYENFTVSFDPQKDMLRNAGNISGFYYSGNNIDFTKDNVGYTKNDVLSDYYNTIINKNFYKKELDNGKTLYDTLYNQLTDKKFFMNIIAKDNNSDNDIQDKGSHKYKGFNLKKEIENSKYSKDNFEYSYKPAILLDDFKIQFQNPNSNKIEDKRNIKTQGLLYIKYKVSTNGYDEVKSTDNGYLGLHMLIRVFDPYNNEIKLFKKDISIPQNKDELFIPIFFNKIYPDGIYSVKAEIFDKNDNKVYNDQYATAFVNKTIPQFSVFLKSNNVNIYDTKNNGYIVDGQQLYQGKTIDAYVYFHKDITDYNYVTINNEKNIVLTVNDVKKYIPYSNITGDKIKYAKVMLSNMDNSLKEGINIFQLQDIYGVKNIATYKLNVIFTPNNTLPTPTLKEENGKLYFKDIILKPKTIKDLNFSYNNKITSLSVFNNNLWLNKNGSIKVVDFAGNENLSFSSEGYNKIKIKDGTLIKEKPNSVSINQTTYSTSIMAVSDYISSDNMLIGLSSAGKLYYYNVKNGSVESANTNMVFAKNPTDIYVEKMFDGSYELYVLDNGTLKIYNIENLTKTNINITKEYGNINEGFNNSIQFTQPVVSFDKAGNMLYLLIKGTNGYQIAFMPIYDNLLTFTVNNKSKIINLNAKANVSQDFYKRKGYTTTDFDIIVDDDNKTKEQLTIHIPGTNSIYIGGLTSLNGIKSTENTLNTTNIIPIKKYELYINGVLKNEKALTDKEGRGGKDVVLKTDYLNEDQTIVLKSILADGSSISTIMPVIKYIYRIPITSNSVADGTYNGTAKVIDKKGNVIYSKNANLVVYDNYIYGDILLYNNKTDSSNNYSGIDKIKGININFISNKGTISILEPLNKGIVEYSIYAQGLIDNTSGKKYKVSDLTKKTEFKKMEKIADNRLKGYVKKDNLVTKQELQSLSNYNWNKFGGLFVCIDKDTADKLRMETAKIYQVIYDNLQTIKDNRLKEDSEYLSKEVLDKTRWIKETKLQVCPTNISNKFINVSDLLNK